MNPPSKIDYNEPAINNAFLETLENSSKEEIYQWFNHDLKNQGNQLASLKFENINHPTPIIILASRTGEKQLPVSFFRDLIEIYKADPKVVLDNGGALSHCAADAGNLELLKFLILEQKLDPKAVDDSGFTVGHEAARSGTLEMVKFLVLECGVDPQATTQDENLTVLQSASYNEENPEIKPWLEHYIENPPIKDVKKALEIITQASPEPPTDRVSAAGSPTEEKANYFHSRAKNNRVLLEAMGGMATKGAMQKFPQVSVL